MNPESIDSVLDWMHERALGPWEIPALLGDLADRLLEAGLPVMRVHIGVPVLHPLYVSRAYTWTPAGGVEIDLYGKGIQADEALQQSPLRPMFERSDNEARITLSAAGGAAEFPMLRRAREEGASEYFAQLSGFYDSDLPIERQEGVAVTWLCDAPGGFTEGDIASLRRLRGPLAVLLRNLAQRQLVDDILDAYLGSYSGKRVLSGQIRRGDGEVIDAVVVFCDLRNSSGLAERYGIERYLEVLNEYFEVTAGSLVEHGGEVLRFIGDASLAIFPFERHESPRAACAAALAAAQEALRRGAQLNRNRLGRGELEIGFGIGLHPGRVMYGNIGTPTRLEFTVIGRAANEAARIESQCRELDEPLLVSGEFARLLPEKWRSLGRFELRNIDDPVEIFAPPSTPV